MLDIGTVLLCLWLKGLLDEICFWNWKLFLSLAISSMVLWRGANLTISEFIAVYMRNKSTFPSGEDTQRHGQRRERVFIDFGNIFLYGPLVYPSSLWNETIIIDPIRDQDQSQRRAVLDGGRSFVRSESVVEIYSNRRVQEPSPPPSPYLNIIG